MLVAGQTQGAVPPAELPARPARPAALGRAHEQRLALLTVFALEGRDGWVQVVGERQYVRCACIC